MKTHTSRWAQNAPTTWILKERSQDGGAVLGSIECKSTCFFVWTAGDAGGWKDSCYAAQRAVRAALKRRARKDGEG